MSWDGLANATNITTLVGLVASPFVHGLYKSHWVTSPSETLLKQCKEELDNIHGRLKTLTPKQREEVYNLTQQGKCKSLEEIERMYLRLMDNSDELSLKTAESSFLDRRIGSSQLRVDIDGLRQKIAELQKDTWNTTTSRMQADRLAQEHAEHAHQPSLPPPTVEPRLQSVSTQSSTTGLEEHRLDITYPPTAHMAATRMPGTAPARK